MAHVQLSDDPGVIILDKAAESLGASRDKILELGFKGELRLYIEVPDYLKCFEVTKFGDRSSDLNVARQLMRMQPDLACPYKKEEIEYLMIGEDDCQSLRVAGHAKRYFFNSGLESFTLMGGNSYENKTPKKMRMGLSTIELDRVFCCFPRDINFQENKNYPDSLVFFPLEVEKLYVSAKELKVYKEAVECKSNIDDVVNITDCDELPSIGKGLPVSSVEIIGCEGLDLRDDNKANEPRDLIVMFSVAKYLFCNENPNKNISNGEIGALFEQFKTDKFKGGLIKQATTLIKPENHVNPEERFKRGGSECLCLPLQSLEDDSEAECECWFLSARMKIMIEAWNKFWCDADLSDSTSYESQSYIGSWIQAEYAGCEIDEDKNQRRWAKDAAKLISPTNWKPSTRKKHDFSVSD